TRVQTVLWSEDDMITILAGSIRHGEFARSVYRLDLADEERRSRFEATDDEDVLGISLSPGGTRALLWTSEGVEVRDYATWDVDTRIEHPDVVHALWQSERRIVVGGRHRVEQVDLGQAGNPATLLAFSQVEQYGYNRDSAAIEVVSYGMRYRLGESGWEEIDELAVREAGVASEEFRVYLENLSSGSYRNMVMVRNVSSFGTDPLFPRPQRRYEPFPAEDDPIDLTNFSHGSRIRRREVSFVFNAIDSVSGLTEILNTLAQYEIRATFFVNGDFIRRHPGAVREIAESGHEVGSLFYTYFDMASGRFQITGEFIKQGLARNEDEYFETTGRELSLQWHAPYYFVNPEIIAASREMNYAYIGRDVDSLDWVPTRDENGLSRLYRGAADIIEAVIDEKRP
ncbi:MAG: polysaccharide deacetylase family protein, partial [Opitutales bacterium]|nr:polysaccharide deacetylase family protein [Opitutales bacterium]